ncbi:GTP cyclohydrolase II [Lentinula edodes]|uniref:GTP cyclohydrolase II n=1 Tax=Lentinula edodes TaxID=5353 RepID=A0A1Q3E859_LENED|nr:GTP cyclohydrolase II [Lentinula edodes]
MLGPSAAPAANNPFSLRNRLNGMYITHHSSSPNTCQPVQVPSPIVLYNNDIYPTATHLPEALKYLPAHPIITNQIPNMTHVPPNRGAIFLDEMVMVLEPKFRQQSKVLDNGFTVVVIGVGLGGASKVQGRIYDSTEKIIFSSHPQERVTEEFQAQDSKLETIWRRTRGTVDTSIREVPKVSAGRSNSSVRPAVTSL